MATGTRGRAQERSGQWLPQSVASMRTSRWVILAGYGLLAACTQLLWLSYASITAQAHRAMGVSEGAVGDLAVIFPLMYVILALPAGPLARCPLRPGAVGSARS